MQNKNSVFNRMRRSARSTRQKVPLRRRGRVRENQGRRRPTRGRILAAANEEAAKIRGNAEAEAARTYAEAIALDPELYQFLRELELLEASLGEDDQLVLPSDHDLLQVLRRPATSPASEPEGQ